MRSSPPEVRQRVPGLRIAGIVPAAGRGERLGGGQPKALRALGGIPMLVWAVRALVAHGPLASVVVAAPHDDVELVRSALLFAGDLDDVAVHVVSGGSTRQESVRIALAELPDDVTHVLVHDAARPFVPAAVVTAVVNALAAGSDAVIPVVPVTDTIRRTRGEQLLDVVPRDELRAVQTPQGFARDVLTRAHENPTAGDATDDASLAEALGVVVLAVPGSPEAFKITSALDLLLAEAVLAHRSRS